MAVRLPSQYGALQIQASQLRDQYLIQRRDGMLLSTNSWFDAAAFCLRCWLSGQTVSWGDTARDNAWERVKTSIEVATQDVEQRLEDLKQRKISTFEEKAELNQAEADLVAVKEAIEALPKDLTPGVSTKRAEQHDREARLNVKIGFNPDLSGLSTQDQIASRMETLHKLSVNKNELRESFITSKVREIVDEMEQHLDPSLDIEGILDENLDQIVPLRDLVKSQFADTNSEDLSRLDEAIKNARRHLSEDAVSIASEQYKVLKTLSDAAKQKVVEKLNPLREQAKKLGIDVPVQGNLTQQVTALRTAIEHGQTAKQFLLKNRINDEALATKQLKEAQAQRQSTNVRYHQTLTAWRDALQVAYEHKGYEANKAEELSKAKTLNIRKLLNEINDERAYEALIKHLEKTGISLEPSKSYKSLKGQAEALFRTLEPYSKYNSQKLEDDKLIASLKNIQKLKREAVENLQKELDALPLLSEQLPEIESRLVEFNSIESALNSLEKEISSLEEEAATLR